MKVTIECPIFRAYLQKEIPAAFDTDGLMDTQHKAVKKMRGVNICNHGVSSLTGIEHFELYDLDADNNPKIKHLPRLPNTLEEFWSNHKFDTSVQPIFFDGGRNFVLLDNGCVLCGYLYCDNLCEFKTWVSKRYDRVEFIPFIAECEAYLSKLNPEQPK
jgi:hypothetical protein